MMMMGSDQMGMMSNRMAGMSGNMPQMNGAMQGYMQQFPNHAGQAYGYFQAPGFADGAANHGANLASHGATGGGLFGAAGGGMTGFLAGLLNFTVAVFAILLVIGLLVGTILLLKRFLIDGSIGTGTTALGITKRSCANCGTTLNQNFNFCPACGEKKVTVNGEPVTA